MFNGSVLMLSNKQANNLESKGASMPPMELAPICGLRADI